MIVAISIDKDFNNFDELKESLNSIAATPGFKGFMSLEHGLIAKFTNFSKLKVQTFPIAWGDLDGAVNIKPNKFGKNYNADAPLLAAKKVVEASTHIVSFGNGDFNINKLSKDNLEKLTIDKAVSSAHKRYKF